MTDALTGPYLRTWATGALDGLRRHRAEINRLNVFPIPDSDTGTNMVSTMECAVSRLTDTAPTAGAAEVAAALAAGAVAGARGNSGMVLSQILRAVADTATMSATGDLSARAVPAMLARAGDLVTEALSDPVEGTILTVLRCAADGAGEVVAADRGAALATVVTAARDAAVTALERTTGQLDVLGEAGVVDAGGRGLVVILQALVDALRDGTPGDGAPQDAPAGVPTDLPDADLSHGAGTEPHLELVFGFRGDAATLRTTLGDLGDSVVLVGDGSGGHRAHVHTVHPGQLLERIFALGTVTGLRIEALPGTPAVSRSTPASPVIALLPPGATDGGLADLFRGAGAAVCDSADSLVTVLDTLTGPGIVLTNGMDTAEIFAGLDRGDREVTVVDTGSFVGGLAALAVHSPGADPEDDAEDMADAVHGQRVTDVTGRAGAGTAVAEVTAAVDDLLADGGELVTVLYRGDLGDAAMTAVAEAVTASHPDAEIHGVPVSGLPVTAQVGVE